MRRDLRWKRRGLHRLFFALVFVPMLCVFPYMRAVNNPNEFTRVFTVMALVESQTFRIDEQVATWGWTNDMARVKSKTDHLEHYYMVKAPGAVYLGAPGYFIFSKIVAPILKKKYPGIHGGDPSPHAKTVASPVSPEELLWWLRMATWSMRIFGVQLPCFFFLLWFERYLRYFTPDTAIRYAAVAAAGLGTNYLAYTHMFASHSQYAAFAFIAFATIETERRRSRGDLLAMRPSRALLAGFCTSACVTLEYHALFMTVVMSLFAMFTFWSPFQALFWVLGKIGIRAAGRLVPLGASVTPTRILAFGFGGLLNVPHMMYFHWTAYGDPFTPGHQKLETAHFAAEHKMGLWGVMWPAWDHIKALAIDPSFGFFGMSPYMWLGLLGGTALFMWPRRGAPRAERWHFRVITLAWMACMAMAFGVNAGFVEWRAGWTVGPRYLVVCAPFFAFGAACALERFAQGSAGRRALARGVGAGLALASIVSIGTVGLVFDTLPEQIARPFAQFAFPMARVGLVPHHVGEWFGWSSTTLWYIACAAMLLTPLVAGLASSPGERRGQIAARVIALVTAFGVGMVPAVTPPEDGSALFVVHPSTLPFVGGWEPPGRDRIALLKEEAERYGTRGIGPCLWYRVADLERVVSQPAAAARDEARAKNIIPKDKCPRMYF